MNTILYKNLLEQVKSILDQHKKIDGLTGENFNVFRILKVEASEVRMHSAFLAELLNPHGSHGQKDVFLKLFAGHFCFKQNILETASCRVKVEEYIGTISEDGTFGGRIDIIISDRHGKQVIIENKIYAGDQEHQLKRYYNQYPDADLIYLTLDGKSPSDGSKGDLIEDTHYKCYSYKNDILKWLEQCRKEVAIFPVIREALTHYINLIKYLTNQTINNAMREELSNLIKLNIEASFAISDNLDHCCRKLSDEFGAMLVDELMSIGLICEYGITFETRYNGFWIHKENWKYVNIGFQFQNYDKGMIFGIVTKEHPIEHPISDDLRNLLRAMPNNTPKNDVWYPWFQHLEEPYSDWSKAEAWLAIQNGKMKDVIIEKVKLLLKMTAEMDRFM